MGQFKRVGSIGIALAVLALGTIAVTAQVWVPPAALEAAVVEGSGMSTDREHLAANQLAAVETSPIEISGGCWIVEPTGRGSARPVTRVSAPSLDGAVVDPEAGTVAADGSLDS